MTSHDTFLTEGSQASARQARIIEVNFPQFDGASSPQKDLRTQETTRSSPSWRSGVEKTGYSQRTTFGVMEVA